MNAPSTAARLGSADVDPPRAHDVARLRAAVLADAAPLVLDLEVEVEDDLGHGAWEACASDHAAVGATGARDVVLVLLTGSRAGQVAAGRLRRIGDQHVISGRTRFSA